MKVINAIDAVFDKILYYIIAFFTIALMVIVNVQVFARYIFTFSLGGVSDLPVYLMIFIIWLGAILGAKKDDHIRVELLCFMTKNERLLKAVHMVMLILTSIAMFYFAKYALDWVLSTYQYATRDPATKIPYWILYAITPFGGFFMGLYYLVNFVKGVGELCHRS